VPGPLTEPCRNCRRSLHWLMRGMLLCDADADGCGLVRNNVCLICSRGCLVVTPDSCNMTGVIYS